MFRKPSERRCGGFAAGGGLLRPCTATSRFSRRREGKKGRAKSSPAPRSPTPVRAPSNILAFQTISRNRSSGPARGGARGGGGGSSGHFGGCVSGGRGGGTTRGGAGGRNRGRLPLSARGAPRGADTETGIPGAPRRTVVAA